VQAPEARGGLGGLAPSPVDPLVGLRQQVGNARLELQNLRQSYDTPVEEQPAYQIPYGPQLGYSPSTGKVGVNGFVFGKDDFASALESEQYLNRPPTPLPRDEVQDWVPLSEDGYNALLKTIKEPGIFDLFGRNVDLGVQGSMQLVGSGLQLVGAEKLGSDIVQGAQQRIEQLAPFQREFTGIQDIGDVGEFLVATLGQFTPSIIESLATGGVGAGIGIGARATAKQLLSKEAKKAFAEDVAKYQAAKKLGDTATMNALAPVVKGKAGYYGALAASAVNSYRIGASDVYNELRQQGVDANDVDAKMAALAYGLPYGALEALPEFFAFSKILNPASVATKPSMRRRVASGVAIGGLGGGATEGGQEAILMAAGEQVAGADYSDEYAKRLINSFAAGAAFGGIAGGGINALQKVDLLKSTTQQETPAAPEAAPAAPLLLPAPAGTQGELFSADAFGTKPGQMELFPETDLGQAPAAPRTGPEQLDLFNQPPAARRGRGRGAGISDMFGGMGQAISENFYKGWYDTLTNGPNKSSAFKKEPKWNIIKQAFDRGEIQSPQDLRNLLTQLEVGTPAATVAPTAPIAPPVDYSVQRELDLGPPFGPDNFPRPAAGLRQPGSGFDITGVPTVAPAAPAAPAAPVQMEMFTPEGLGQAPATPVAPAPPVSPPIPSSLRGGQLDMFSYQQPFGTPAGAPPRVSPYILRRGRRGVDEPPPAAPEPTPEVQPTAPGAEEIKARGRSRRRPAPEAAAPEAAAPEAAAPEAAAPEAAAQSNASYEAYLKAREQEPDLTYEDFLEEDIVRTPNYQKNPLAYLMKRVTSETDPKAKLSWETGVNSVLRKYIAEGNKERELIKGAIIKKKINFRKKTVKTKVNNVMTALEAIINHSSSLSQNLFNILENDKTLTDYEREIFKLSERKIGSAEYRLREYLLPTSKLYDLVSDFKNNGMQLPAYNKVIKEILSSYDALAGMLDQFAASQDIDPNPPGGGGGGVTKIRKEAAAKPAAPEAAAPKGEALKEKPKGAAVDENDGAVRVGREAGLRYVEYQTSVLAINERLQFAIEDSDKAVRLFDKNPAAAIRSIAQNVIAAVGNRKYAVSNTLKKLKTDLENLAARASAGEDTNVLKQEFEELVSQLKNEYAAFRKREAALVPKERGPAPVAGAEQPAAAGATAGGRRAGPAARKGAAETGPAKDQGVPKEAPVRQIKTLEQAQEALVAHATNPTLTATIAGSEQFANAALKIVDAAFFDTTWDATDKKKAEREAVIDRLNTLILNEQQRKLFNAAFLIKLNAPARESIQARANTGKFKGRERPWYTYAKLHGLLAGIREGIRVTNIPEADKKSGVAAGVSEEASKVRPADPENQPVQDDTIDLTSGKPKRAIDFLARALEIQYNSSVMPELTGSKRSNAVKDYINDAIDSYDPAIDGGESFLGSPLSSFQQKDGKLEYKALEKAIANASKGSFIRTDGREIKTAVDWIKSKNTVNKILAKLHVKPTAHVYKNLEALRRANPDLYRRADAARTDGAFATTPFAGYSFGNEIIILTDQIKTEQELKFVLAHETLGHFGLRSIMTDKELNDVLFKLLNENQSFQRKVLRHAAIYKDFTDKARDAFLTAKNKNFYEATKMPAGFNMNLIEAAEEVLSDYAAELDNNILFRVWNAIKDALNKIGIKFGDETARYFIRQAGRYLRTGDTTFISPAILEQNMRKLATEAVIGRFSASPQPSSVSAAIAGAVDLKTEVAADNTLSKRLPRSASAAVTSSRQLLRFLGKGTSKILEKVQSLDSIGDLSQGINELYNLFKEQSSFTQRLLQKYNNLTKKTQSAAFATNEQRLLAGKMAAFFTLYRQNRLTDKAEQGKLDKIGEIGDISQGFFVFNTKNLDEVLGMAKPDIEMFKKGFEVNVSAEAAQLKVPQTALKMQAIPGLTEDSKEWIIFNELLAVEQEKTKDILQSKYERYLELIKETNDKFARIQTASKAPLTPDQLKFFYDLRDKYMELIHLAENDKGKLEVVSLPTAKTIGRGMEFVVEVMMALHDKAKVKDWAEGTADTPAAKYYKDPAFKHIVDKIPEMNQLGITKSHQIGFIKPIFTNLAAEEQTLVLAEQNAKRTIGMGYVPLLRRGKWNVRLEAYDPDTGRVVTIGDGIRSQLPFYMAADEDEATMIASRLSVFENREFLLPTDDYARDNYSEKSVTVKFRVTTSETAKNPPLGHAIDFSDFLRALTKINVNLTAQEQVNVIQALTGMEDAIRRVLLRSGTVGWDPDIIQSVSIDTQTGAHVASKNRYSFRTDEIMSNDKNWRGDRELLKRLERELEDAKASGNQALVTIAAQRYAEYAYRYVHMADRKPNAPEIIKIGNEKLETKGYGERYRDEAKRLLTFYAQSTNIIDSTQGFLTETAAPLKNFAVLLQLGMNFSSALLNLVTIVFNVIPYLGTHNAQRGYGGGFGLTAASQEVIQALNQLRDFVFNDAESLRQMIDKNEYGKYGLTFDEAVFLLNQTEEGNLQPALTNTLLQTARGGVKSNIQAKAEKVWMGMFTYTEQLSRRATALAAYRLYRKRAVAAGIPEAEFTAKNKLALLQSEAFKDVYRQAGTAVDKTNGDYSLYNRPELFRNHFTQFIFMYKMIVVITVQMVAALPLKGKMYYLAAVLILAGFKGLPFAENLFDLIDTLAQFFDIPLGSIEAAALEMLEGIAPGLGAVGMNGLANLAGLDIASKTGMGAPVPAMGIARAGADTGRELMELAGPVFSAMYGTLDTSFQLAHWGAAQLGVGYEKATLPEILRNAPSSGIKGFADGLTYLSDGRITDAKGRVVSNDVSMTVIIGRMLGFYPTEAANSNTAIRLSTYAADYAKALKADFRSRYVQAYLKKDYARMRETLEDVRRFNEGARGTEFFIRDFERNAIKSAKEAATPAAARYLKVAPEASKGMVEDLINIYGLDEGTE
jgi:hypothetical protein